MTSTLRPYAGPENAPFYWQGDGDWAALLVHGFPGTPMEMRSVGQVLHAMGWTVQGILLPGFGPDFFQIDQYTYEDWAAAIEAATAGLRAQYPRVALAGNSVGAALSLLTSARMNVDALLLFAPFWRVNNRVIDGLYPLARRLLPELRVFKQADFSDRELRDMLYQILPDADLDDPATQAAIRELTFPVSVLGEVRAAGRAGYAAAPQVTAPVTIVQGKADVLAHPSLTPRLAAQLAGPAELHLVEGDHELTRMKPGTQADIVNAIQQFALARMAQSGRGLEADAPA
ncbi:MAG: alpha/beta fold hydrolase [Caldilineaceae bacterium]|nr:alpha/beta fold hydrolase [Caldilineaceae bacterium]